MPEETDIFARLAAPFPIEAVSWRVGSTSNKRAGGKYPLGTTAKALAYIDARDVMDRFDMVVGPDKWQSTFVNAGNGATCCQIGLYINGEWIWKADGAGQTNVEGDKGQFSDALKRAAVSWGVGRYLYTIPSPRVAITEWGYIVDSEKPKLLEALQKVTTSIEWGDVTDRNTCRLLVEAIREFDSGNLSAFMAGHQGMVNSLPVAMRNHIENEIQRITEAETEAA